MANKPEASIRRACYENTLSLTEIGYLSGLKGVVKSISNSVDHSQFDAAATTDYVDMTLQLPADCIVLGVKVAVTESFAATGLTAAAITVGKSGAEDAFTNSAISVLATGTSGSICKTTGVAYNDAAVAPRITLTLTGANCSALTAGAATVTVYYVELN